MDEDFVTATCKPGTADCCRYLVLMEGWGCAKLIPDLKALLDQRVAEGTIRAVGDNCPGIRDA